MKRRIQDAEIIGQLFGHLMPTREVESVGGRRERRFACMCRCGRSVEVWLGNLLSGHTRSCGCEARRMRSETAGEIHWPDSVGLRFGRLVVVEYLGRTIQGLPLVKVRCDCGTTKATTTSALQSGDTVSCGCKHRSDCRTLTVTHGEARVGSQSAEYTCWLSMRSRCRNHGASGWKNYGARGIRVCDRWEHSFELFLADMGRRPTARHSLDRIDPNGNYEPQNCRWATMLQQKRNTRTAVVVEALGRKLCISEWADEMGIPKRVIYQRLRAGWGNEEALTVPVKACATATIVKTAEGEEET